MRLRALEPEDLELLYTIENDSSLWWLATTTAPYSRYRLRDYISANENDIYKDEQIRFVIEWQDKAIGMIDLFDYSPKNGRAEMGVALLKEAQGKGLARQAIGMIADYARNVVHMEQIYSVVPESNIASLRMLEATGFVRSGTLKRWIRNGENYENAAVMQLFLHK